MGTLPRLSPARTRVRYLLSQLPETILAFTDSSIEMVTSKKKASVVEPLRDVLKQQLSKSLNIYIKVIVFAKYYTLQSCVDCASIA